MPKRPLDVLEASVGEPVTVLLKDDTRYRGTLAGYDQHLNVVLEDATIGDETRENDGTPEGEGQRGGEEAPEESTDGRPTARDTIVIRGDNVVSIVP